VLHAELGAGATSALAQAARELLAETESPLDDAAVAAALELLEPFRHDEAEAARAAHKAAVEAVQEASEAERQLAPKEAIAASGGYGAGLEWRQLHGRCFEAEDRGFTYKARWREMARDCARLHEIARGSPTRRDCTRLHQIAPDCLHLQGVRFPGRPLPLAPPAHTVWNPLVRRSRPRLHETSRAAHIA